MFIIRTTTEQHTRRELFDELYNILLNNAEIELIDRDDFEEILEKSYKLIYEILENDITEKTILAELAMSKHLITICKDYSPQRTELFLKMVDEFLDK